jgi:hypothetical protein
MKYLFSVGFVFINALVLHAQSDFRNGYYINNNNDTVFGLINYKGNKANAKKCIYRENIDSKNQLFTPDQIKGYRFINSKYYVSKTVYNETKTEQLFLEYLLSGIIDLYYYRDEKGEHYFVDNGNEKLYELKNEEKEIIINNSRYVKESKEYMNILKAIFKESPEVSKRVESIKLNHKSLIDITHDYHNEICKDEECIIYEKKLPKLKSSFGIVAGLNCISIVETHTLSGNLYYLNNSNFGFSFFPSIGLYYKKNMPFINERMYFQYEGTYSYVNITTSNSYSTPSYHIFYINDISFTKNVLNNLIFVKYEFPKGKIRPTFQVGGFANYLFKTDYERNLEAQFAWGSTYYTEQFYDSPFLKFDFGINCGVGFKSLIFSNKEIFFDLRYQRGFLLLKGINTNTLSMNLGLQLGK